MYFRKTSPRTTCLYSAASTWPRSSSAASHIFASKPRLAPPFEPFDFLDRPVPVMLSSLDPRTYSRLVPVGALAPRAPLRLSRDLRHPLVTAPGASPPRDYE